MPSGPRQSSTFTRRGNTSGIRLAYAALLGTALCSPFAELDGREDGGCVAVDGAGVGCADVLGVWGVVGAVSDVGGRGATILTTSGAWGGC